MTNENIAHKVTEEEAIAVVRFALKVGEHLLINGGEISRVEDTIQRICTAYGAARVDVFAITSVIMLTAIWSGGVVVTQTRRVKGIDKNTTRLEAINSISRSVCANPIPVKEAHKKLDEALEKGKLGKMRFLIGSLIATVSFAAFFGGDWKDVLITFFVTFLIVGSQFANSYLGGNRILANVLCCFFASTAATVLCYWTGASLDMVMAGCIMVLIPGIAMTSAIENLIMGDTLSGMLGLMEAAITALALAGGFMLSQMMMGDLLAGAPVAVEPTGAFFHGIQVLMSFAGSIGFSLLFGLRGKQLPVAAIGAAITWGVYLVAEFFGAGVFFANVLAAVFAGLYTEVMVRFLKVPKTVLTFSVVVALIPGRALYRTMKYIFKNDYSNFVDNGIVTLSVAAGIAIGITIVLVCAQIHNKIRANRKNKTSA